MAVRVEDKRVLAGLVARHYDPTEQANVNLVDFAMEVMEEYDMWIENERLETENQYG